jgi:hypothetical protein
LASSRERLPLLHRLWAGIAKVKVEVKARESHRVKAIFLAALEQNLA